jgi:MFS family permease
MRSSPGPWLEWGRRQRLLDRLRAVSGLRRQFSLLGGAPGFRLLFLATLGSSLGTLLATVALVVDVKDRTDSGPWVSALMLVEFMPAVVVGLFFGPLLDRFSRRGLMVASDLVRLFVFCLLPFADSPGTIVALAGIAGFATGFFRPAVYAGLPNLVDERDLGRANSLIQTGENVSWTVAPVIGGIIVAAWGPELAYWINAGSFLVSALLLLRIAGGSLQGAIAASHGHLRDLREGIAHVVRTRALLTVLVVWTIALGAVASTQTAQIFLAKDAFDAGDFGYGLIFGCIGLGLAIGSFEAGGWVERRSVGTVYAASILLQAIGIAGAAVSPNVWASLPCFVLAGVGNGTAVVCNSLLVQRGAPDYLRGRVFTVIMSVNYAVYGLGFVIAGPLTDGVGPRWVFGGVAVVLALASLVAYALARGAEKTAEQPAGAEAA